MNVLERAKALKRETVSIKGSIVLDEKNLEALENLLKIVGEKELLTLVLSEPKTLKQSLIKRSKNVKKTLSTRIELGIREKEELEFLKGLGFSMSDILSVAFDRLNIIKSLKDIESESLIDVEKG